MLPVNPVATEKIRDAERSRDAILDAGERLFAERGYEGTSLHDIAAAAGLSRGTPSYFFGSKEQLYVEVLDHAFAQRQAATAEAFAPVHEWCRGEGGLEELRCALASAAEDYLRFLSRRRSFGRLVVHEELDGGRRMQARTKASTAMQDAFAALRQVGRARGLRDFDPDDAILVFVGLTFVPASFQHTLMRAVGRNLDRSSGRKAQVELAVDQLMHLLTG